MKYMRKLLPFVLLCIALPLSAAGSSASLRSAGHFYQQKKYGQALADYKNLLQKNPQNEEAAFGAGASAYQLKDYTAARQFFETAAQDDKNPRTADAYFNMGNTFYRAGDLKKSIAAYRKALAVNPSDKEAIHNLQLVLNQQQQNQQNKNNQNQQNQDKDSKNQDKNQSPQNKGDAPQDKNEQGNEKPSQPDQLKQDDAQRVMQMARDNEYKAQPHAAKPTTVTVEKDW
jgi:tetratricopeptide (TPR) repeat protein